MIKINLRGNNMNKRKENLDENKSKEKQGYNTNCIGNNNRTKRFRVVIMKKSQYPKSKMRVKKKKPLTKNFKRIEKEEYG